MNDMSFSLDNKESLTIGAYLKGRNCSTFHRVFIWLESEDRLSISVPNPGGAGFDDLQVSITNGGIISVKSPLKIKADTGDVLQQSKAGSEDFAKISARMLELAADPCRDGYVPMSPETLREWAQKLLPC